MSKTWIELLNEALILVDQARLDCSMDDEDVNKCFDIIGKLEEILKEV